MHVFKTIGSDRYEKVLVDPDTKQSTPTGEIYRLATEADAPGDKDDVTITDPEDFSFKRLRKI